MKLITASCLLVSIFQGIFADELPSNFKKCSSKDTTCLKEAVNDALPKLANGLKNLGVPSLDPLELKKVTVASGKIVQLVQNYEKIDVGGLSKSKVDDLSLDLDNGKMTMDLLVPVIELKGVYRVKGKILVLDVYGTGDFLLRLENVKSKANLELQKYDKNGETYIKVTKFDLELDPDHVYYQFDNLFDRNKQLGDNINNVLNDNWKEIYDELNDGYVKAAAAALKKLSNKLFEKIPLKYIFPSSLGLP